MDFLAEWPAWAILALTGAIGGAIGSGVAVLLRANFPPNSRAPLLVTGAAIMIGIIVGNSVVLPALARSDAGACRAAEFAASELNRTQTGVRIDDITTAGTMTVDCTARSISYTLILSRPRAEFTAAALDGIRATFNAAQCSSAGWRGYIDDGWTVANVYTFADGTAETMAANCEGVAGPLAP
ncbi:MAG: hypothetical protein IT534_11550 [Bauldia sp.]|nr:hypothetical protein [Bauldia sp.]